MKVAIYLGSFNPFHYGHLEVVETALCEFDVDEVVIVPSMQNPWKKEKPVSMDDRIEIIWETLPTWVITHTTIDPIEEKLIPPYYSYATLHALKNKYCNDDVYVLCGEDTINDILNWMNGEQIIKDFDFLIVDRPENAISSTEIRNKVKNNESIEDLVDSDVIELIKKCYK